MTGISNLPQGGRMSDQKSPRLGYLQLDIMESIEHGVVESPSIAEHLGRKKPEVWDSLGALVRRRLVVRTRDPGYGGVPGCSPGAYALTEFGRSEYLRALEMGHLPGVPRVREGGR
jgi:hypothetical protein